MAVIGAKFLLPGPARRCLLPGADPPDQQGRSDRQLPSAAAIGHNAGWAWSWGH